MSRALAAESRETRGREQGEKKDERRKKIQACAHGSGVADDGDRKKHRPFPSPTMASASFCSTSAGREESMRAPAVTKRERKKKLVFTILRVERRVTQKREN